MTSVHKLFTIIKALQTSTKFLLGAFIIASSTFIYTALAMPPDSVYNPGETLAPICAPGDTNCTVSVSQEGHAYLADIAGITANQGDIMYFDGTNWVDLSPGTSGQFLQTQGAAANPQWASSVTTLTGLTDTTVGGEASGNLLLWDGTNSWDNKVMSGDIAIDAAGATTVQADAVALGTDTTGIYIDSIVDFGNNVITVGTTGTEDIAVTLDITNGGIVEDDLAANLAFDDGDFFDLAAILHNDTAVQGLRLPQIGTSPSNPVSGEGYIGWDETNNTLEYFDGTNWTEVGGGLWTDGTNGHYNNTEGVIVGGDVAETLANTGFTLAAGNLFVADELGVEGTIYTDTGLTVGASTIYADGSITPITGTALSVILGGAAGDDLIVNTDTLVVESDNNRVGIGTTAPGALFDISGATGTEIIRFTDETTADSVGFYTGNGDPSTVITAEAGSLYLDQAGKVFANTDGVTAWTDLTASGGSIYFGASGATGTTSGSTPLKIPFSSAQVIDPENGFSDADDWYVIPEDGDYLISGGSQNIADGLDSHWRMYLYKNGSTIISEGYVSPIDNEDVSISIGPIIVSLVTGDTIHLTGRKVGTSTGFRFSKCYFNVNKL